MKRIALGLTLLFLCALPAAAQAKKRKKRVEAKLAKIAAQLEVPIEALRAVGGERFASRKKVDRRALLGEIAEKRPVELVPLVVALARKDKDLDCRTSAVALFSVLGLDADRTAYLDVIYPAMVDLFKDKYERVYFGAADQALVLARWFRHDKEVVDLFETTFDGKHYRLAQRAWEGLIALENPDLRAGVVQRAMREVQDRRSRFAVFERRLAFRENGPRGGPWPAKDLAVMVVEDGTVAVACTQALADLGDPVALPALRRIDRTSAHVLRVPALITRGILGDVTLLGELQETLDSDHLTIQCALVTAIGKLKADKVDAVLARLAKLAKAPALQRAVALARLERNDEGEYDVLRKELQGGAPQVAIARRILAIETEAAGPLVVAIAANQAFKKERHQAVARLGDDRIGGERALEVLRGLTKGEEKNALRLVAAASLLQLEEKAAAKRILEALTDYDIVNRVDVKTGVGTARRFNGSPLIAVLRRLAATGTLAAAPLLTEWLDPPEPKAAAEPEAAAEGGGTRERATPSEVEPAKVPPWLEHQLVRAEAVTALGELVGALALRLEAPQAGDDAKELKAWRLAGVRALARSLVDSRGVVRRAATGALVALAGGELPRGASLAEEAKALVAGQAWLERQRTTGG